MRKLKYKISILVLIIIICIVVFIYLGIVNKKQSAYWRSTADQYGKTISIGQGHKLFVRIRGKGAPIIVIESGLGSISSEWWEIQDALSQYTTVVSYNRAGYGWSSENNSSGSSLIQSKIKDLNILLNKLQLNKPLILVGHEIGGYYIQQFARKYPDKISGLVYIDPLTPDFSLFKKELSRPVYKNLIDKSSNIKVARILADAGIIRALNAVPYNTIPDYINKQHIIEQFSLSGTYDTMLSEYNGVLDPKNKKIQQNSTLKSIPSVLIHRSSEKYKKQLKIFRLSYYEIEQIDNLWIKMFINVVDNSSVSNILVSEKTTRYMHLEDPEIIISAIKQLLKK